VRYFHLAEIREGSFIDASSATHQEALPSLWEGQAMKNQGSNAWEWLLNWKPHPPRRVLVVEDDELAKPILARILYSLNDELSLTWVKNAKAAKRCLEKEAFDLVITDVVLEGEGTGMDIHRYCSRHCPETAVVITSGLSREAIEKKTGHRVDDLAYMQKPIVPRISREKIKGVIERRWFSKVSALLF
jgi:DNA-binding NtrC family response regulator